MQNQQSCTELSLGGAQRGIREIVPQRNRRGGGGSVLYTCTNNFNFTVNFLPFTSISYFGRANFMSINFCKYVNLTKILMAKIANHENSTETGGGSKSMRLLILLFQFFQVRTKSLIKIHVQNNCHSNQMIEMQYLTFLLTWLGYLYLLIVKTRTFSYLTE